MPKITVLPAEVAEKIAAGEVIERPVSVVKELVENCIDAGAASISVEIERGGKAMIRVADDGCGMTRDDFQIAFARHATSKISTIDDLFNIRTMGFRGEALASVAAVARVNAVTRSAEDESGWEIAIEPPEAPVLRGAGRGPGTTIEVRDLFFNIPARRKFLKRDETELGHITRYLQAVALAFPGISITLVSNARKVFSAPAVDSVRRRVAAFYGEDLAEDLLETEGGGEGLRVYALLAPPFYSRVNSYSQYAYVNNRFVRDRVLQSAVSQSFRGLLDQRRFPIVFLYITIAPQEVDVNVHPTKMEIRFRNASSVRSTVVAVLSQALLKADFVPTITAPGPAPLSPRADNIRRSIEAFYENRVAQPGDFHAAGSTAHPGGQGLPFSRSPGTGPVYPSGSLMQVRGTYIVQETDEGIAIIDQHALHERILYSRIRQRLDAGNLQGQRLLVPEVVEVTPAERLALETAHEALLKLGIDVEPFGEDAVAFHSFPAVLGDANRERLTRDLISDLVQARGYQSLDDALTALAALLACHSAVRAGDSLSPEELDALLRKAEETEAHYACPHGRPTKLVLTFDELERRFKRK